MVSEVATKEKKFEVTEAVMRLGFFCNQYSIILRWVKFHYEVDKFWVKARVQALGFLHYI